MESDDRLRVDLHIHSTASDGTLSPSQVLNQALHEALAAIAITDHDSLEGVKEVVQNEIPAPLKFITGVEISAKAPSLYSTGGSLHILGYGLQPWDESLNAALKKLQAARKNRNPEIIERLNRMGLSLTMAEVEHITKTDQPGRPHIAQALVAKAWARSVDDAFDRLLAKGQPAYVDKYRIPCREAIDLIRGAGGMAVLAHPGLVKLPAGQTLEGLIHALMDMGLQGLEVFYPGHSAEAQKKYAALADQYGLTITGGSDFHGDLYPDIRMGYGKGELFVPVSVYDTIQQVLENQRLYRMGNSS